MMKVMPVSTGTGEFVGSVIILMMMMTLMKIFFMPGMFPARVLRVTRDARAVGVCSSSAQCKDDEASDKTDLRHEHADTPKPNACPSGLSKRC